MARAGDGRARSRPSQHPALRRRGRVCADALLGPEPGGRETAGAEAQETPSPPIRRSRRPWTFQDLKRAHRMHGSAKDTDDPMRHLYLGLAKQMAGHAGASGASFRAFVREAVHVHGDDLEAALAHYRAEMRQAEDIELASDYEAAVEVLLACQERREERRARSRCAVQ